ncbi:winged helix DNA-binding domain-containing protein [Yinghuangia soli]|uniref:Winged helix DNA-binding domain-containing protein n=1 Tax=Yinghuangia soli TaxID=2908204 RepID=A0AA41Q066_9ACTN|nr:winged helix DNA-binding domain-containing protein [Yinghuangia soli]MCF2529135.1 winged helix DNA-binding domain-containing protein [Yinghuangia soli]
MTDAAVRTVDTAERRTRLVRRHLLGGPPAAVPPLDVARTLVALHSTDPASVFLSVAARSTATSADVEQALYEDRSLLRMFGMRRTVFVFPADFAPVVHSSTTAAIAAKERREMLKLGFGDGTVPDAWLDEVEASVVAQLAGLPDASSAELAELEPRLRETLVYGVGTKWETEQAASMRVLRKLSMDGAIVRGRPRGSWTSSQYRWSAAEPHPDAPADAARADLVRAWLGAFGPGTEADVKWWTGWTLTQARAALKAVNAVPVALLGPDGSAAGTGYVLPDDVDPVTDGTAPRAALLPALDPTPMGWQQRDWYLDEACRTELFDRSGNIGPSVWWQGRIVGGWAQRADGSVVWRLLADAGAEAEASVAAEAERLGAWIGGVRVTPRFRTPLERDLTA